MLAHASRRQVGPGRRPVAASSSVRELARGRPLDDQQQQEERDRRTAPGRASAAAARLACLCPVHGDTSGGSLAMLTAGRYRKLSTSVAPGGADVGVDVVDDGVLPVDQQRWRGRRLLVGRPAPARRAGRRAWPASRSSAQRARTALETTRPVFRPPSLNVGSLGPATRLPQTNGNSVACAAAMPQQPQHRGGEVEAVQVHRRDGAVPLGEPHRRHPEADVTGDAHTPGLAAQARIGGADLVVGRQLQVGCSAAISVNIALIASGVIGISGDFIHLNSAASCLLVPMISGTGCERPSRASFTG